MRARIVRRQFACALAGGERFPIVSRRGEQQAQVPMCSGVVRLRCDRRPGNAQRLVTLSFVEGGLKRGQQDLGVQNRYSARISTARGEPKKLSWKRSRSRSMYRSSVTFRTCNEISHCGNPVYEKLRSARV